MNYVVDVLMGTGHAGGGALVTVSPCPTPSSRPTWSALRSLQLKLFSSFLHNLCNVWFFEELLSPHAFVTATFVRRFFSSPIHELRIKRAAVKPFLLLRLVRVHIAVAARDLIIFAAVNADAVCQCHLSPVSDGLFALVGPCLNTIIMDVGHKRRKFRFCRSFA